MPKYILSNMLNKAHISNRHHRIYIYIYMYIYIYIYIYVCMYIYDGRKVSLVLITA